MVVGASLGDGSSQKSPQLTLVVNKHRIAFGSVRLALDRVVYNVEVPR